MALKSEVSLHPDYADYEKAVNELYRLLTNRYGDIDIILKSYGIEIKLYKEAPIIIDGEEYTFPNEYTLISPYVNEGEVKKAFKRIVSKFEHTFYTNRDFL